jgi:hypothetical protein
VELRQGICRPLNAQICHETAHLLFSPHAYQTPFAPNPIIHGKNNQAPNPTDNIPLLDNAGKKRIQQVVGSFLYYAQAVNPNILMALSNIATRQSAPTKTTKKRVDQFLDYMWMQPDAII